MEKAKVIELKETILEDNNADAQVLRQELKAQKTCLMNLMSSPGSGKTSTLLALKPHFEGKIKWGVMEAAVSLEPSKVRRKLRHVLYTVRYYILHLSRQM